MKKILVVDDDEALRKALVERLAQEGYEVSEAANGADGLSQFEAHDPDLIILDVLMPQMNGIEMLKELRSKDRGKSIDVIVLTNSDDTNTMAETVDLDAQVFMSKAKSQLKDVVDKVHEVLGPA